MFGISSFDKVKSLARNASRNSIAMKTTSINEEQAKDGSSRIGGQPDLPPDFTWPRCDNKSMSFIAQINLGDSAKYDEESLLPAKGILYFSMIKLRKRGALIRKTKAIGWYIIMMEMVKI